MLWAHVPDGRKRSGPTLPRVEQGRREEDGDGPTTGREGVVRRVCVLIFVNDEGSVLTASFPPKMAYRRARSSCSVGRSLSRVNALET